MRTSIPPDMRESGNNAIPARPPPAYSDILENNTIGETYYRPPPPPSVSYMPPVQPPIGTRVVEFYSPPNDRRLALRRRVSSGFCILVILAIIIGLAAGLTKSSYDSCECHNDSDCVGLYGTGFYCYSDCECATK